MPDRQNKSDEDYLDNLLNAITNPPSEEEDELDLLGDVAKEFTQKADKTIEKVDLFHNSDDDLDISSDMEQTEYPLDVLDIPMDGLDSDEVNKGNIISDIEDFIQDQESTDHDLYQEPDESKGYGDMDQDIKELYGMLDSLDNKEENLMSAIDDNALLDDQDMLDGSDIPDIDFIPDMNVSPDMDMATDLDDIPDLTSIPIIPDKRSLNEHEPSDEEVDPKGKKKKEKKKKKAKEKDNDVKDVNVKKSGLFTGKKSKEDTNTDESNSEDEQYENSRVNRQKSRDDFDDDEETTNDDNSKTKSKKKSKDKKDTSKKEPKAKKPKKEKVISDIPEEKIKIKPIVVILMFSIISGVILSYNFIISSFTYNQKIKEATACYVAEDYKSAYEYLLGLNMNSTDKIFYNQVKTVMYVEGKYQSYLNFKELDMSAEAVDALIKGVGKYDLYKGKAQDYGAFEDMQIVYNKILTKLQEDYAVTENQARELALIDDQIQYSREIYKIVGTE